MNRTERLRYVNVLQQYKNVISKKTVGKATPNDLRLETIFIILLTFCYKHNTHIER